MSLISEIRELLDESGGAVFWVDEQLYDAVNEVVLDVFGSSRHEYAVGTITTTASVSEYAVPATLWIPQYITRSGRLYWPTTLAKLEQYDREWKLAPVGEPKHFVLNDPSSIMTYPPPDDTYSVLVHGVPWPTVGEIADGAEDITISALLRRAIIRRVCAELLEYTQPNLADQYIAEAEELEHKYRMQLRNRQSHNIRRIRPGDIVSGAKSGVLEIGRRYS